MMQIYYMRAGWISGIALTIAFLLTFSKPTHPRLVLASILWAVSLFASHGLSAYNTSFQGMMAYGFNSSSGFPLPAWLFPLWDLLMIAAGWALLFSWVSRERALHLGKILFLIVWPAYLVISSLTIAILQNNTIHSHLDWYCPFTWDWIGATLLWFRIRESNPLP